MVEEKGVPKSENTDDDGVPTKDDLPKLLQCFQDEFEGSRKGAAIMISKGEVKALLNKSLDEWIKAVTEVATE
eukprot:7960973-Karenia_brevis.AAC.1